MIERKDGKLVAGETIRIGQAAEVGPDGRLYLVDPYDRAENGREWTPGEKLPVCRCLTLSAMPLAGIDLVYLERLARTARDNCPAHGLYATRPVTPPSPA